MNAPHLKCSSGDIAKYVIIPGDPARVKLIASFLKDTKETGNNREFLTYKGKYKSIGVASTSTGIGCPSAAIAVEELANLGAEVVIRLGTCGGLLKEMQSGDIVIPLAAMRCDGTTKEYVQKEFPALADLGVINALIRAAEDLKLRVFVGINRTHDAFYETTENFVKLADITSKTKMLVSSEMECSAVFLTAMLRGLKAGAVLVVVTPEPPEDVKNNPSIVYDLVDEKRVKEGVNNAIKLVLRAIEVLENENK